MKTSIFPLLQVSVYHVGQRLLDAVGEWSNDNENGVEWRVVRPAEAAEWDATQYALASALVSLLDGPDDLSGCYELLAALTDERCRTGDDK